jgi:NAD(P)-dependent dehydrogenase (short-subunit alcohol dehydrogenase family)
MTTKSKPLALVTGAGSGIGKATTERLLRNGARVVAVDRSSETLRALARGMKARKPLWTKAFNLADIAGIPHLIQELASEHGPVTWLVNNAGIWFTAPIEKMTDDEWNATLTVNLTAPFALIRAVIPGMVAAGGGRIVNVSSRNAFRSTNNVAAYDASKAGLLGLTRTAAGELAKYRIRVNAVCPGVTNTPALRDWVNDKAFYAAYTKQIPMGRFGRPEEIAAVISFLLSDDAEYITGQTIITDGGQIACQDNERFREILKVKRKVSRKT